MKGGFHENCAVADWAEHFRREAERYRDGESRLPDAEDADTRQRQLTRLGNASAAPGSHSLMQGRTEEAREWFDRACERYRESWADAPPGSWGRPIAILKARILAGTGREPSATRGGRSSRAPREADVADRPLRRGARASAS